MVETEGGLEGGREAGNAAVALLGTPHAAESPMLL